MCAMLTPVLHFFFILTFAAHSCLKGRLHLFYFSLLFLSFFLFVSGTELLQYSRYPKHTGWLERLFAFLSQRLVLQDAQHLAQAG